MSDHPTSLEQKIQHLSCQIGPADTAADSVGTLTTRDAATMGVRARPPIGGDPSPPPHRGRHGLVALATGRRTNENLGHRFWTVLTPRIELHEEPLG